MESLELPQDILWDGDQSPTLSPSHYSDASSEQILLLEDTFTNEIIPIDDDLMKPGEYEIEFELDDFDQLLEIQQELLQNMEEDGSNDQWLDQPIVPMDEYAPVQYARANPVKGNTAQLLNEFNQVYDAVELTHLTPPETPPNTPPQTPPGYLNDSQNQFYSQPIANNQLQFNEQLSQFKSGQKESFINNNDFSVQPTLSIQFPSILEQAINLVQQSNPIEYGEDNDDAMAGIDALVRSRAEDLTESSYDDDSSMSSTCFSPRSETSSTSTTDDSEWMKTSMAIGSALKSKQSKQKRKPRQNRRSLEDRQSRKKEQNKSAANRYRQKKKVEIEILQDEERELQKQHDKLHLQYNDISREVKYIKSLLRDAFKAKGMI